MKKDAYVIKHSPLKFYLLLFLSHMMVVSGLPATALGNSSGGWSFGYHAGLSSPWGTTASGGFPLVSELTANHGLFVHYGFNQIFGVRAQFTTGKQAGEGVGRSFMGYISEYGLQGSISLNHLAFPNANLNEQHSIYFTGGAGVLQFASTLYHGESRVRSSAAGNTLFIPLGLGYRFMPNPRFYLFVEMAHRMPFTTELDAFPGNNEVNDWYNYTSLGVAFTPSALLEHGEFVFVNRPYRSWYVNAGLGASSMHNIGVHIRQALNPVRGMGFKLEGGMMRRFSSLLSYGIGLNFSQYASEIESAEFYFSDLYTINGGDYVYQDVSEKINLASLGIPLFLEFGNVNIDKPGLYARIGLLTSLIFAERFDPRGRYREADHSQTPSNSLYGADETLGDHSLQIATIVGAGFSAPLDGRWILTGGLVYCHGLTPAVGGTSSQSPDPGDVRLHTYNDGSRARFFGLEFGVQYMLQVY